MKTSNLFGLNWQDFIKGLVVSVGSAVAQVLYTTVQAGSLSVNWKAVGLTAASAFLAYMLKNFFTPAKIVYPAEIK